jgi:hypothetical protein
MMSTVKRVILFVIDGLGAGSPDPEIRHHTIRSILTAAPPDAFPHLTTLGLREYVTSQSPPPRLWPSGTTLDSYLGHLEMIRSDHMPDCSDSTTFETRSQPNWQQAPTQRAIRCATRRGRRYHYLRYPRRTNWPQPHCARRQPGVRKRHAGGC